MKTAAALTPIPLVDLVSQYQTIKDEIDPVIQETVEQGAFVMGDRVDTLEKDFAAYCGAKFAVGCSSGTSALHLALLSAGIGAGDEVITSTHTFVATAEAIIHAGATPVFVDIDPGSYGLDPDQVETAITPKTKAIIPVHIYGQVVDMEQILAIAARRGVVVIEDAAQAHGADCDSGRAGSMGELGCFSFYPGKNLGAFGDAGIVTFNDEKYLNQLRLLVNHGRETKYTHTMVGFNHRLDALQAAVLSVKLRHLDNWNHARRRRAHRYSELLHGVDVQTPVEERGHVYHLYVIQCEDRDGVRKALGAEGIATGVHYPVPLHLQPCLSHVPGAVKDRFPVAEKMAERIISLPIYPEMTDEQQDRVIAGIRRFLGQ